MGTTVDVIGDRVPVAIDDALRWLRCALLSSEAEPTIAFFALSPQAQALAVEALRSSARGAIDAAGIDAPALIAIVSDKHRRWLTRSGS